MKLKTANYNFTDKDLLERLTLIKKISKDVLNKKISGIEYLAFLETQIKEVEFINRVNDAKKNNQSEVEYG